ncbi:hypothetical protein MLD52_08180 [Puniceicoccaceae bacterium K14]|nr:hypothetical protein [Puniceicoccaceae bacterium K14]
MGLPIVSIVGDAFQINGQPTYAGRYWEGNKIEGLLLNSRMVQGVFDDENPDTRDLFKYSDTRTWDPNRNTDEFVAAMDSWVSYGLNCFTLNLQGGSPTGYGNAEWLNSAFTSDGSLKPAYVERLNRILAKAEELDMVVILGLYYFGQDQHLEDEAAVVRGVDEVVNWVLVEGYRNVMIEICNECDIPEYTHEVLRPSRVHELIERVKCYEVDGQRLLASVSFRGGAIPTAKVVASADFILLHGNDVEDTEFIKEMVVQTKAISGYRGQPIVFNEDDHYDYDKPESNFRSAIESYASWGYFDYRRSNEKDISIGYQSVPVDWGVNDSRKRAFFEYVKVIAGL